MQDDRGPRRIGRRALLAGLAGLGVAGTGVLQACRGTARPRDAVPRATTPARIGVLWPAGEYAPTFTDKELGPELARLGQVVGRDYLWEVRNAEGKTERHAELAAELVGLPCDIITAASTATALALQQATRTIPLVVAPPNALGTGLVTNLARPGGNLTGFTFGGRAQTRAKVKLLKDVVPGLVRVAALTSTDEPSSGSAAEYADGLADELDLKIRVLNANSAAAVESALEAALAWSAEALVTVPAPLFNPAKYGGVGELIVDFALRRRLPLVVTDGAGLLPGPLLNYADVDPAERAQVMARQIDRILRGARPGHLPMQQGMMVTLTVNLKTAQTLGLTIPPIVLARATAIIQ